MTQAENESRQLAWRNIVCGEKENKDICMEEMICVDILLEFIVSFFQFLVCFVINAVKTKFRLICLIKHPERE